MGPIRAFIRPSHAAAHEHSTTTASLFCPTQSFSVQHPSLCSHVTPSLAPHHHHHHHQPGRHPFYAASAGANPLHAAAGLMSSASQPCFYNHFKSFIPPTSPLVSHLPVLTALRKSPGENARTVVDKEGRGADRWGGSQDDYEWVDGVDEGPSLSSRNAFSSNPIALEVHKEIGLAKWKASTSLRDDWNKWNVNSKKKEKEDGCKGKRSSKEEIKSNKKENTGHVSGLSSSLPKHEEEPLSSSSRVDFVFPISDDDDDDEEEEDEEELNEEGSVPDGEYRRRVTWRISDIVETEDEEGETLQNEKVEDILEEAEDRFGISNKNGKSVEKNRSREAESVREDNEEKRLGYNSISTELSHSSPKEDSLVSIIRGSRIPILKVHKRFGNIITSESNIITSESNIVTSESNIVTSESTDRKNSCSSDLVSNENDTKNIHSKAAEKSQVKKEPQCESRVNKDDQNERRTCQKEKETRRVVEGDDEEEDEGEEEGEEEAGDGEPYPNGVRVTQRLRPRSYRQFLLTRERRSRVFLKERSYHLGRWFVSNFTHPYPSKEQKDILAAKASMTRHQVSEWFGNMRRRIREATRGLGICWEERVRIYNSVITGKSEPLPILPEDDINTWAPTKSHEPLVTDSHEEVSASPKFKTTLLHRYLNNPEAPSLRIEDGSIVATSFIMATVTGASSTVITNTSCFQNLMESPKTGFPQILPLCTSSPKESIKELWNSSFENIGDNYRPLVNSRSSSKDQKGSSISAHTVEDKKIVRKYEGPVNSTSKRPRLGLGSIGDWFQGPSTSKQFSEYTPDGDLENEIGRATRGTPVTETPKFPLSYWSSKRIGVNGSKPSEEGVIEERKLHKPEEIAAAYTLVELQHM